MSISEIKTLIDKKFNNNFEQFLAIARVKYNQSLNKYFKEMPWNIRKFEKWQYVETALINEIPNLHNYIIRYDQSTGIPKEGEISLCIDMVKDEDIKMIYYFSYDNIHKLAVELMDGTIEEGLEVFYFDTMKQ